MRLLSACAVLAAVAVSGGYTSGHAASSARSASPAPHAVRARPTPVAQRLCVAALHRPVAASSATTVGDLRGGERDGPAPPVGDTSHRPAAHAFRSSSPAAPAAFCTVGSPSLYTFYGAGPDGTAVELEGAGGWSGPVPDQPPPIP